MANLEEIVAGSSVNGLSGKSAVTIISAKSKQEKLCNDTQMQIC